MLFFAKYLASQEAIVDKLSIESFGVRIYLRRAPAGCPRPLVVLNDVGGAPEYQLKGEIGDLPKTLQVDVYADSAAECDEISELIRLAPTSGYRGLMDQTYVHAVTIERESGTTEEPASGLDAPIYRNSIDYRVHFNRAVVHSSY